MSKKSPKPQHVTPTNAQCHSQERVEFTVSAVNKPVGEKIGNKHKTDALVMARTSLTNLLASAKNVLDTIESGNDVKFAFIAHKAEVDAYHKAINRLSLHTEPKAVKHDGAVRDRK